MDPTVIHHKLTAILCSDVVGYSRMMGNDPKATLNALTECREIFSSHTEKNRGRVVSTPGDAILAEFGSVLEAVQCAVDIQHDLTDRNQGLPANNKMEFRIGINLGDVMVKDGDIFGDGVNVASRLESLSKPGGVWISGQAYREVKNHLPFYFEFMGDHRVKNITDPVSAYRVLEKSMDKGSSVSRVKRAVFLKLRKKAMMLAAALVLMAAGGIAITYLMLEPPIDDKPSIAVMAFNNMSGDPDQEHFSDGISEDIITDLSKISGLLVVARNSSFTFKGKPFNVPEVARKLGVKFLLEGSVRRAPGRVKITAQLIDGKSGKHLWAEKYDRKLVDVFAVQDEITEKIVKNLKIQITLPESERIRNKTTESLEAWEYYRKGQKFYRKLEGFSHIQAWSMYDKALGIDKNFGAAMVGLGYLLVYAEQYGNDDLTEEISDPLERAKEFAEKALKLNVAYAEPYALLSLIRLAKKQNDTAIALAEKAITLEPNSADIQANLAHILSKSGEHEKALDPIEFAIRLNPLPPENYLYTMGEIFYFSGRAIETIKILEENFKESSYVPAKFLLLASYVAAGQTDKIKDKEKVRRILDFPDFVTPASAFDKLFRLNIQADRKRLQDDLAKAGLTVE